jgi:hypothetical protein
MMTVAVLLLSLILIDLTTGQIPNPNQYRFTLTTDGIAQERYAIDKQAGKMSRLWFSNVGDEEFGGNQEIYVRDDARTYLFNFMAKPPQCIANRGGPYNEINYWPNLIQSFGGEQKPYDELIFDADCDGTCLTWKTEYNETYHHYRYVNRLYVKKAEEKPIKLVMKRYSMETGQLVSTSVTRFSNWTTGKVPDYEYDYPMDLETCYKP